MKLTFIGACHEVTGSCFYLTACGKHILVDYGMEQGVNAYENQSIPVPAQMIDYVLLTHAHIDHSGLLPLLSKNGFNGEIHATRPTADLCAIMLRDSAHIQEFEAEWRNRKAQRAGREAYIPLYEMADAEAAIERFVAHPYDEAFELCEGIRVRFTDVGHLLGSSSVEAWVTEGDQTEKIVFSGDIGNIGQPLLRSPQYIEDADYIVMESTYGDRSHGPPPDHIGEFAAIIQETLDRGGNVVIPSFAVGRTQELLYFLRKIKSDGLVKNHGHFPVYVDSPLAIQATQIFVKNQRDCYDDEAIALLRSGVNPLEFDGLTVAVTSDESKQINFDKRPKVIISASGMCEAGRIKHHLKHNLWRPESTVVFAGYQAVGTLGRSILDGAGKAKLFGEVIEIHAQVTRLQGISGHADNTGLMAWLSAFGKKPKKVFIIHGEDSVCNVFAERVKNELGIDAMAPFSGTEYDLAENVCLYQAVGIPYKKPVSVIRPFPLLRTDFPAQPSSARPSASFGRLFAAGMRLMNLIQASAGHANKDLAKLADQINALCDKWDR